MYEVRDIDKCYKKLEALNFPVEDYFVRRDELVTGEKMPGDPIKVDSGSGKKPGVTFDHKVHKEKNADQKCADCHHNEADGKYKCRECHQMEAGDAPKIKDAMHKKEMGKCWGCHRAKEAPYKKKCAECHVKE